MNWLEEWRDKNHVNSTKLNKKYKNGKNTEEK